MIPLVPLYAAGVAMRSAGLRYGLEPVQRLKWPVISVGNLSAGGTGKTPFTMALVRLLQEQGIHVDVLTRGYGRRSTEIERVKAEGNAEQFGDEPLLIARRTGAPVYVGAQRYQAGRLAEHEANSKAGAHLLGVHILDDGFQHRQLGRQVDIVLVNSEDLQDALLPAGNLREGLHALKRAGVLAVPDQDDSAVERLQELGFGPRLCQPIWRYRRAMEAPEIPESLATRPIVAFCGIARPEQFFSGLTQKGFHLAVSRAFPDHHRFTKADVAMLRKLVESTGSGALVTTAKDFIRLDDFAKTLDSAGPIFAVDLQVAFGDEAGIIAWLRQALHLPMRASS
jgi:tetraacyldisaccharide 4'-kinase